MIPAIKLANKNTILTNEELMILYKSLINETENIKINNNDNKQNKFVIIKYNDFKVMIHTKTSNISITYFFKENSIFKTFKEWYNMPINKQIFEFCIKQINKTKLFKLPFKYTGKYENSHGLYIPKFFLPLFINFISTQEYILNIKYYIK